LPSVTGFDHSVAGFILSVAGIDPSVAVFLPSVAKILCSAAIFFQLYLQYVFIPLHNLIFKMKFRLTEKGEI
jgi:hypothetical protein